MGGPTPLPSLPTVGRSSCDVEVLQVSSPCCSFIKEKQHDDGDSITDDTSSSISSSSEPMMETEEKEETTLQVDKRDPAIFPQHDDADDGDSSTTTDTGSNILSSTSEPVMETEENEETTLREDSPATLDTSTAQQHPPHSASSATIEKVVTLPQKKSVKFHAKIVYYPHKKQQVALKKQDFWVTVGELRAMKRDMDHTAYLVLRHQEFRAAMDRLRALIRGRNLLSSTAITAGCHFHGQTARNKHAQKKTSAPTTDVDVNVDSCSHLRGDDLARLLIDCDVRGVERLILARLDDVTRQIRPTKQHVETVLKAQVMFRRKSPHQRAALLSQRCYTKASSEWAQTLGQADADAVASEFMLSL